LAPFWAQKSSRSSFFPEKRNRWCFNADAGATAERLEAVLARLRALQ
jgi:hypothetical protein